MCFKTYVPHFLDRLLCCFCRLFSVGRDTSKKSTCFWSTSELTWNDVKIHRKSISINIKYPKSSPSFLEKVYLFNFKLKKFCPVRNLKKLKKLLSKENLFSRFFPVFWLNSKSFLTQKAVNDFQKSNFKNVYIRGHSFRAGIPTSIANFPDISNDSHIMGWGRWQSKTFSTYQKAKKKQKRWIFRKIERALLKS